MVSYSRLENKVLQQQREGEWSVLPMVVVEYFYVLIYRGKSFPRLQFRELGFEEFLSS